MKKKLLPTDLDLTLFCHNVPTGFLFLESLYFLETSIFILFVIVVLVSLGI